MTTEGISRRHALTGAAAAGVGVPLLAACGGADTAPGSSAAGGGGSAGGGTGGGSRGGGGTGGGAKPTGTTLGPATDVPVGGGKVYADQKVVVTQPKAGEFKGFSAVCTHQGCLVSQIANGTIDCLCHGSRFSAADGSVVNGPATSPLPKVDVSVHGGQVTTA